MRMTVCDAGTEGRHTTPATERADQVIDHDVRAMREEREAGTVGLAPETARPTRIDAG